MFRTKRDGGNERKERRNENARRNGRERRKKSGGKGRKKAGERKKSHRRQLLPRNIPTRSRETKRLRLERSMILDYSMMFN